MNIFVPYEWLKEHLQTTVAPNKMQAILSLSGPSVERIQTIHNEPVFEIEVTTNRMDMASVVGVAREASVILSQNGYKSSIKKLPIHTITSKDVTHEIKNYPISLHNDAKLCPRIMGVFMDVKIGSSPDWMKKRLEQAGIRSLNNVIDVTNYVMLELGQPLHVFDADRLGNHMMIRESKKGEQITTLDGKTYTLSGGDIVADNGRGELIDLIGIMGTANSVVVDTTRRIFLFSEHADPKHIRKTSMGLAIRTNAAQLNEKMLDPNLVRTAMLRAVKLLEDIAHGEVSSKILDIFPKPPKLKTIILSLKKTVAYLGIEIPVKMQAGILEKLGCSVKKTATALVVTAPSYRPDIEIPVDLIEEIARIYGYHNLPSTLMDTALPTAYPEHTDFAMEHIIKLFLADMGWQEVYTYSAVSKELAEQSGYPLKQHLALQNPLTDEHMYMRRSLTPSLMEVLDHNPQKKHLSVFELAQTYTPKEHQLPDQGMHLAMVSNQEYRTVKGVLEAFCRRFFFVPIFEQTGDTTAQIYVEHERERVLLGVISSKQQRISVDIQLQSFLRVAKKYPQYQSISQFEAITEDFTFTLPEKTQIADVIQTMKQTHKRIASVVFNNQFNQNYTFSVSYQDPEKQLRAEDVSSVRSKLIGNIEKTYKAQLIGQK